MILRLLKLIVFLFLIGVISTFISYTEGRTKIDWLGWGIDLETSHFIMILIFVSFFFIFIDRLWRLVISFPKSALLRRDERNRECDIYLSFATTNYQNRDYLNAIINYVQ